MVIKREKARIRLRHMAAQILLLWWRRLKGTLTARQKNADRFVLRRQFLEAQLETLQEVEDLEGMNSKVKKVGARIAVIEDTLEKMAEKLWDHEQAQAHEYAWAGMALR